MREIVTKCVDFCKLYENELYVGCLLVLTAFFAFGLGRISKIYELREPVKVIEQQAAVTEAVSTTAPAVSKAAEQNVGGEVLASKNGKKYYLPWCAGAKRISEANKVWFKSKADAERAGYTPAANCKGL
jgi:hypothetical protein